MIKIKQLRFVIKRQDVFGLITLCTQDYEDAKYFNQILQTDGYYIFENNKDVSKKYRNKKYN